MVLYDPRTAFVVGTLTLFIDDHDDDAAAATVSGATASAAATSGLDRQLMKRLQTNTRLPKTQLNRAQDDFSLKLS